MKGKPLTYISLAGRVSNDLIGGIGSLDICTTWGSTKRGK